MSDPSTNEKLMPPSIGQVKALKHFGITIDPDKNTRHEVAKLLSQMLVAKGIGTKDSRGVKAPWNQPKPKTEPNLEVRAMLRQISVLECSLVHANRMVAGLVEIIKQVTSGGDIKTYAHGKYPDVIVDNVQYTTTHKGMEITATWRI